MTKKHLALGLALLLMVLAAGCGKNVDQEGNKIQPQTANTNTSGQKSSGTSGNTTPGTGTTNTTNNQPQQSFFAPEPAKVAEKVNLGPLKIGDTAKVGPLTVVVAEKAVVAKAAGLPPGYDYLVMKVTITNDGKDDYTINATEHLKMTTPEGKPSAMSVQATAQKSPRLQGTLQSGKSVTGWIGYLVKAQPGEFQYKFTHPDYGDATYTFTIQ